MATAFAQPSGALDQIIYWDAARPGAATYFAGLDDETHVLRARGAGAWQHDDAGRYFEEQRRLVEEARRRYGPLRAFFDVRDWVVENHNSALQFKDINTELYRPEDRLVAVVNSSLFKQYPRTAFGNCQLEVFISMHAAETWLQAYADQRHAA